VALLGSKTSAVESVLPPGTSTLPLWSKVNTKSILAFDIAAPGVNCPVEGSNVSAPLSTSPLALTPPARSTLPSERIVAACLVLEVVIVPAL
jgi:hypothetical protein